MKAFRILAIVFGVLTLLIGIGPIVRDTSLASEISSLGGLAGLADLPSSGILYFAMVIALALTIAVIVGIVFSFKKHPKLMMLSYVILGLSLLSIIIHPSVKMGFGSASPREVAVFHAIPAILTGIFLLLFARKASAETK